MSTAYCPEVLKETTKALRIVVLPTPNHECCPLHRGGISDSIIFFERKMQDFVLRICRPRTVYAEATRSVREADIHLFVLQGDSALLNHLQSSWWATLMVSLMPAYLLQINACPAVRTRMFLHLQHKPPPLKPYPVGVQFSKPSSMLTLHLCQGMTSGLCYQLHRISVHSHVSTKETLQFKFTISYVIRCRSKFSSVNFLQSN
jgi:hypothetical protein